MQWNPDSSRDAMEYLNMYLVVQCGIQIHHGDYIQSANDGLVLPVATKLTSQLSASSECLDKSVSEDLLTRFNKRDHLTLVLQLQSKCD